jgi:hypothetical protein
MKYWSLIIPLHLFGLSMAAQEITRPVRLKTGMLTASTNLRHQSHFIDSLRKFQFRNRFYTLVQFNHLPNDEERRELLKDGIVLYDYIPDNTYLAEVNSQAGASQLAKNNVAGIYTLKATAKIAADLVSALKQPARDPHRVIAVSFYGNIDKGTVTAELQKAGAQILETTIQPAQVIFIDASAAVVQKIATLPFVSYISSEDTKPELLNYKNRGAHAVNALSAIAGRNLQGNNVTVGIGDEGNAMHLDLTGRLITQMSSYLSDHSTHVTGSVGGAGILNPKNKGMAPQATIINAFLDNILTNAPNNAADFNLVLTSNAYSLGRGGCVNNGSYTVYSNYVDVQMNSNPELLHVFAAGNDGSTTCSPFPASFATVKPGLQSAKNGLTVGAIDNGTYAIASFSSRGPTVDGRLKPEVVTGGWAITSTITDNRYASYYGTSCASPTAAGMLALLYERYRQLHAGNNPTAALIKAIACNGADDMGNPGPDFTFGFGNMNARNSVEAIENNTWFSGTTGNGGSTTFTIPSVPPGNAQIKILLYWNDRAAATGAASTLVNDLDLTVTAPDAKVHYPLILDPSSANVNKVAVEGVDSRNNIEQVVINNPPAGNFAVTVKGTGIAQGPQDFVVVYQVIQPAVKVEYPFGEETLVPGETEIIRWNASDANTNTFTIEYSLDNGQTWVTINNSVAATSRSYAWMVPAAVASTAASIRVSRNNTAYTDASDYNFTILDTTNITVTNKCPGYTNLAWSSIPAATSYDIMMLKGSSMEVIATTTNTSYLLAGLNKDSTYWLAIRGVMGTVKGRRSTAQRVTPSGGSCASPDFDNDLTPDLWLAPVTGRKYTSSQLGLLAPRVRLANRGSIATAGAVSLSYQVNGSVPVTETASINIAANADQIYTFASSYDFSNPGIYTVKVWLSFPADGLHNNDTLTTIIRHLKNDPIVLSPSFTEGFETAADQTYYTGAMGFAGLDRCDFSSNDSSGRARTFINSAFARTGRHAITLDREVYDTTLNSLILTYNLSTYAGSKALWLSLYFMNHGYDLGAPGNQVWIRGSDHDAWIPVYTFPANPVRNKYHAMPAINIVEALANASPAQTVSSSFQVTLGEEGVSYTTSINTFGAGNTFDDVTLSLRRDDAGVVQLVAPPVNVCAFGSHERITIQVKNYSTDTLAKVPVSYKVNNMAIVRDTIPVMAPGETVNHTFTQTADLSAFIPYTIAAWTNYSTDSYSVNDTIVSRLTVTAEVFTATRVNNTALLQWETCSSNGDQFIIERSVDSINYSITGTVAGTGNNTAITQYQLIDEQPATGINYYRIKVADNNNGKFRYSPVRSLDFEDIFRITIKPNPVRNGVIYINSSANCNRISLHDATGRLIKTVAVSGLQTQLPVQGIARGVYIITVLTDSGKKVEKILLE